jgi:hypothetical protein
VFWVISVYFNIRNTLLKSGTFLLEHPVYVIRRLKVNLFLGLVKHAYLVLSFSVEEHCSLSGSPVTFAMLSLYILFIE